MVCFSNKTTMIKDKKITTLDTLNSHHGIIFGNFIGYGGGDFLIRTTKENIACYVYMPRMRAVFSDESIGTIYAILPAGSKLEADPIIMMDSKQREYSRKTYNKKSIIFYKIPFKAKYTGKKAKIRVIKGKEKILETLILMPTSGQLDTFTNVLKLSDEDAIFIPDVKVSSRAKINVVSDILDIMKTEVLNKGVRLIVSHNLSRKASARITVEIISKNQKQRREYEAIVVPVRTIEIDINYTPEITTNDSIIVYIKNNASKSIPFKIYGKKIKEKKEGRVKEKADLKVRIKPKVDTTDLRIEVKDELTVEYGEYIKRRISIPISFILYNVEAINKKAKKIYAVTKDKNVVIRNLSEELGITPDELQKIIKL